MALSQDDLIKLANNPIRGINTVVNDVETSWFNRRININSKSHPFVCATDLILGSTYGVLNRIDDAISKLFPRHARKLTDLSRHMSEEERFGIFGNPSSGTLQFAIDEETYMSLAKDVTVELGKSTFMYKLLLVPKDTEITSNGYVFAIENGVEIRYSLQTGYQIVYDDTTNNPFSPIADNLLKRDRKVIDGRVYLIVDIPARQLGCKAVENLTSNESSGCLGEIQYADYIYGVSAFIIQNGVRKPLLVTFDQDVFAPAVPTLTLELDTVAKSFKYQIPDVYIANKLGVGTVSIYVYTTKGALELDLTKTDIDGIKVNYQDYRYGAGKVNEYSAGLINTGGVAWQMMGPSSGGTTPLTFEQLKQAWIDGRRQRVIPITENNLVGAVENYGYSSVKAIDYLTGRSYAVTKELPLQTNKKFFSPMGCFVGSYMASANSMVASGVVIDNGQRVTIPHNVLFDVTTPITKLVNRLTKDEYMGMGTEQIVDLIGHNTLVYTPFYYVLDMTNAQAVLRTYHLDQPVLNYQTFKSENAALGLEVGVGSIAIEHQDDGYLITLVTSSGTSYKELDNNDLGLQLSIQPLDSSSLANMAATLYGTTPEGERVWQFKLETRFDIDTSDVIYFNNFSQFGQVQPSTGTLLDMEMTFIFTHTGDKLETGTESDAKIDDTLFRTEMVAIIETQYSVTLGKKLSNLYSRIRPLVGEAQYKRHKQDIPQTYETAIFKRDANGDLVFENGEVVILHRAGDPMYTDTVPPKPILKYKVGDVVVDENGKPIEVSPRDLKYHWDFIAFDGAYFFSKDPYDKTFAQDTKRVFLEVISKDMEAFTETALDRTNLVYQPRSKLGFQQVLVNNNSRSFLKQDLSFVVTYYLTKNGMKNENLKTALEKSTPQIINTSLFDAKTIGVNDIATLLKTDVSKEVVAVKLNALAGDESIDVISNTDNLTGFSVRKVLAPGGTGQVSIREDIDVVFLLHDAGSVEMS